MDRKALGMIDPPEELIETIRSSKILAAMHRYPPEEFLGEGAYKWVYGSGDFAVGLTMYGRQAKYEIQSLGRLESMGIPVVEVVEWIRGRVGGMLVMRRCLKVRRVTARLQDWCSRIADILDGHKVLVPDVHVMLDGSRRPLLADPLRIRRKSRDEKQMFKFADLVEGGRTTWDLFSP
jgi:hypothetical protein